MEKRRKERKEGNKMGEEGKGRKLNRMEENGWKKRHKLRKKWRKNGTG